MKACINNIIPSTFIDGPGSRMAIFMQGCNMRCLYCHNPETQNLCNSCGECIKVCAFSALKREGDRVLYNEALCKNCDMCIRHCPNFSSPKARFMEVSELYKIIKTNEDFLDGITISGGECTLWSDFIYRLFTMLKADTKLTAFIDTNGYIKKEDLYKLVSVTDGFMVDLKAFEPQKHKQLTGLSVEPILDNIKFLSHIKLLYEVRTVIAEGFNDDLEQIREMACFIKNLNDYTKYKLIPFRPMGVRTYMSSHDSFNQEKFDLLFFEASKILNERAVKSL